MISNRQLFLRHVAQTSDAPLLIEVERAEGIYLHTPEGKRYVDFISGIAVSNVGHCAPEVVAAVQAQAATYMHAMVYGEFVLSPQAMLAAELVRVLQSPSEEKEPLDNVYFVNSGAEAIEGAMKLAKKFTGRSRILTFRNSYHGGTHGALSISGSEWIKEGYGPFLPGVEFLPYNEPQALSAIDENTAAVFLEPIQGEAGVVPAHPCFLRAIRERCTATGALMVLDEIQTGFGRTGTLFAHQAYRVQPDVLCMAKSMGGGMPIGAFVAPGRIMRRMASDPVLGHITTFGGHPVSSAASLAALRKLLDEDLIGKMPPKEALVREMLDIPGAKLRGRGLMFALEVGSFERVQAIIQECLAEGLLTDWFLNCDTAVRIAPPLIVTLEQLREALQVLRKATLSVFA